VPTEALALAFLPGAAGIVIGGALSLSAAIRYRRTSRWGVRLSILGVGLMPLVPGLVILFGFVPGHLLWPSAIFGGTNVGFGLVFLEFLRRNWSHRGSGSN
jgi:hypothetical protein